MKTSRQEWPKPVELQIKYGAVPEDIYGHVFIIGAVGFGERHPQKAPIFNGDGMIYRFDFIPAEDGAGKSVRLSSQIAKTPCYYADQASQNLDKNNELVSLGFSFHSLGFGRFSPVLGLRNEVNTAFLPFKAPDGSQRLLVTYDAGRPYEIDLESLQLITPVGINSEWIAETPFPCVFPPVLCTAHPVSDPTTGEVFMVNYGRSVANILGWLKRSQLGAGISKWLDSFMLSLATINDHADFRLRSSRWFARLIERVLKWLPSSDSDFTRVIRWDGIGDLESWKILVDGKPAIIQQTVHQMGLSKDYIILADTAFQFGLEQAIMNPFPDADKLDQLLQKLLLKPLNPNTTFYIINRSDLNRASKNVNAIRVVVEREIVHFTCDFQNGDHEVTICAAHNCASDVSIPIHEFDRLAVPPHELVDPYLVGMVGTQMDIGKLGSYTIDLKAQTVSKAVVIDNVCTWGIGLFTHRGQYADKHRHIYWQSLGYWPQLQTDAQLDLYHTYPYRTTPISELLSGTPNQRPASLFHLDVEMMTITDQYHFPEVQIDPSASGPDGQPGAGGCLTSSPQFVPRFGSQSKDQTDGYIICPVTFETFQEIWIFDAKRLSQGPICRLGHQDLCMGYTIHTTWLPSIEKRTATYNIPIDKDYPFSSEAYLSDMPKRLRTEARKFFNENVRGHFVRE